MDYFMELKGVTFEDIFDEKKSDDTNVQSNGEKDLVSDLGVKETWLSPQLYTNVTYFGRLDTLVIAGFLHSDNICIIITKSFIFETKYSSRYMLHLNYYTSYSIIICYMTNKAKPVKKQPDNLQSKAT